ncbi:MAG: ATP-binding protein [Lysobacteraceae bacterium]
MLRPSSFFHTRYLYYGLVILAVSLVLGAAAYNAFSASQEKRATEWVGQMQRVQAAINDVVAEYAETESSGLRYVLTGRDDILDRYEEAVRKLDEHMQRVIQLVSGTPEQAERLQSLGDELDRRQRSMRALIETAQTDGVEVAAEVVRRGGEVEFDDQVRWLASGLQYEESRRLSERQQELDAVITQKNATLWLMNGLALVAGIIGFLAIRHSRKAQADQRIAELRAEQAMNASAEKSAFLASMSHEIRTPMNALYGYSELLAKTPDSPRAREYIRAIQTSGEALMALINDILDLSKIEAGKLTLDPEPVDIRGLMDSTLAVFAEPAARKQLQLSAHVAPAVPAALMLDSARLRQVLMNLLSNAVKYTDDGEVRTAVSCVPGTAEGHIHMIIEVSDTGIGMDEEKQRRLFEPFYRGDEETIAEREGSGLGLAIVKKLLLLMNGKISIQSRLGEGSRVRVTFSDVPLVDGDSDTTEPGAPDVDFDTLTPSRVLIVDDVAWNRDLLAAYIGSDTHTIELAADGREAVDRVQSFHPDIVLMDLRMPHMDGRTATASIRREAGEDAPSIIAVTASSLQDRSDAANEIFDGYLRKPVSRRALFETLREIVGQPVDDSADLSSDEAVEDDASSTALDRQQAIAGLRLIVEQDLDEVVASLRVRAVRTMADELVRLGVLGGFQRIRQFGGRLRAAADRFDVVTMESLLRQLPAYVADIGEDNGVVE